MNREGHLVANHSNRHLSPKTVDDSKILLDIKQWEDLYVSLIGKLPKTKFYRPPEGSYNERIVEGAKRMGYTTVLWGYSNYDWDENDQPTKSYALDHLTRNIQKGDIILFHSVSKTNTEMMDQYIDSLRKMGLNFKLLTE